jgi:hypothetical protein
LLVRFGLISTTHQRFLLAVSAAKLISAPFYCWSPTYSTNHINALRIF